MFLLLDPFLSTGNYFVLPLHVFIPSILPVNKPGLVLQTCFYLTILRTTVLCYDCVGPSLPQDNYPKFTGVITLF